MLSLTAMRSANLDTKIAVNHQHKQLAFQAAENGFAHLTTLNKVELRALAVPNAIGDYDTNTNVVPTANFIATDPNAHNGADLELTLKEISLPGAYKYSGYGLSVVSIIYQADMKGSVTNANATAHNRMDVALIRDD
jgi:type IV pilus assembly protein PilX